MRPFSSSGYYRATGDALRVLRLDLTAVQTAADKGDVDAVKKLANEIHGVMSAERGGVVAAGPVPAPQEAAMSVSGTDHGRKRDSIEAPLDDRPSHGWRFSFRGSAAR